MVLHPDVQSTRSHAELIPSVTDTVPGSRRTPRRVHRRLAPHDSLEVDNMRGHVAKKGSHYYAVVYEGVDALTGKDRHRWYAAGATPKGAEKLLAEIVKRIHDGDYRSPERVSLGDYFWTVGCRSRNLSCDHPPSVRIATT